VRIDVADDDADELSQGDTFRNVSAQESAAVQGASEG
jgi:hypothetical protein